MDRRAPLIVLALSGLLLAGCNRLTSDKARAILLNSDGDAFEKSIFVDLGFLNAHCSQPTTTAKYAILEKAGVISIRPTGANIEVITTSKGDEAFTAVGAERMNLQRLKLITGQQTCNLRSWAVPIAERRLLEVSITPAGSDSADVTYKWQWKPNQLGAYFASDSDAYRSLSRGLQDQLIESDPDHELPLDNSLPHATRVRFTKDDNGAWRVER